MVMSKKYNHHIFSPSSREMIVAPDRPQGRINTKVLKPRQVSRLIVNKNSFGGNVPLESIYKGARGYGSKTVR